MKHAGTAALQGLAELLDQIRTKGGIKERKLGVCYRNPNPSAFSLGPGEIEDGSARMLISLHFAGTVLADNG